MESYYFRVLFLFLCSLHSFSCYAVKGKVHFVNVLQGHCTFIEFESNIHPPLLVDYGSSNAESKEKYIKPIVDVLNRQSNFKKLNIITTHADKDHLNCIQKLLEKTYEEFKNTPQPQIVIKFLLGGKETDYHSQNSGTLLKFLRNKNIEYKFTSVTDGDTEINWLGYAGIVTHLFGEKTLNSFLEPLLPLDDDASRNARSVVLRFTLTDPKVSFFLCGDATGVTMSALANHFQIEKKQDLSELESDILLVSHHGSISHDTNNPFFLKTINPKVAIIGAGFNAGYNHPNILILPQIISWSRVKTQIDRHVLLFAPHTQFVPLVEITRVC